MNLKEIKVYSYSNKSKMFLLFGRIHVTSSYLSNISDEGLASAIMHEIGHSLRLKKNIGFIIFMGLVTVCFNLILHPIIFYGVFAPFLYLVFCWFTRRGEFFADIYSLTYTSSQGIREVLLIEHRNLDNKLANLFYVFRWHPVYWQRLENLGL